MNKTRKSAAFLQALNIPAEPETPKPEPSPAPVIERPIAPSVEKRKGMKHIGGYFACEDVEKFAILRARLRLDNSELIKLAIDELFRKHQAKRAFGDD